MPDASRSGAGRILPALAAVPMLLVAACTSVPFDYPKSESLAVAPSDETRLGQQAAAWRAQNKPGMSGFYPLFEGNDALGARLRLIERAGKTIDAQYFLIKGDLAGSLFAGKLLRAADRGVRVRFLVDDVFTTGLDEELALLNSHANVEVRLFNPVSRQGFQSLNFLADFRRANRRMHNKSFTVDNVVTIVGGRNIADEYFQIGTEADFADFEVIGIGPVAAQVSKTFDIFWNSARAVPMEAFGRRVDAAQLDTLRQSMERYIAEADDGIYGRAVNSPFFDDLVAGRIEPIPSVAHVVTDRPEKLKVPIGGGQTLAGVLRRLIDEAEREVIFLTPNFVPRDAGVALLSEARARGVRVVILTNSLASTNHPVVHSGYAPYRRALLEAGVELYEVKVDAGGPLPLTMHTKAAVFDREVLFVGSLNLDPRSIDINTEMGVFLDSPGIGDRFAKIVDAATRRFTYRVVLDDGALEWRYEDGAAPLVRTYEPDASFGRNFVADFARLLPIEDQL